MTPEIQRRVRGHNTQGQRGALEGTEWVNFTSRKRRHIDLPKHVEK